MQEAFRQAAGKNPKNPSARDVFDSSDQIKRESRERAQARELFHLGMDFQEIGREWFLFKGRPRAASWNKITEQKVKGKWDKAFRVLLQKGQTEQSELLRSFAVGLRLTEENPHYAYQPIIDTLSAYDEKLGILDRIRSKPVRTHLSPVSKMFILVFTDIQNYPQDIKDDLAEFLLTKSGFSGRIVLN